MQARIDDGRRVKRKPTVRGDEQKANNLWGQGGRRESKENIGWKEDQTLKGGADMMEKEKIKGGRLYK